MAKQGISIDARHERSRYSPDRLHVELRCPPDSAETMSIHLGFSDSPSCGFDVYSPARARELAQQLRGAADALVDFALTLEQPKNFAAAEVRP